MLTRYCCLLLLAAAALAGAQAPYTPPAYPRVLAGAAPLRMLVASRQAMLAWKGAAAVTVINGEDRTVALAMRAGEMLGIARGADGRTSLRKDGANLRAAPQIVRLESQEAIKLWTPTPDTWTAYPAPLLIITLPDGTVSAAVELPLEEYLRDVLPAEVVPSFHPQMMRAQAIVARTYALCKLGRHADEGADVCADVHCQVFGPANRRAKSTEEAIAATKGLILLHRERLAEPYYSSCCGGITDDAGYVWGPEYARAYLEGVLDAPRTTNPGDVRITELLGMKDGYCAASSSYRWERRYPAAEVNALVAKNLPIVTGDPKVTMATVSDLRVEERTPRGRVATLRVEGGGASILVFGDQARWLFGSGVPGGDGLWSALFDITLTRDAAGTPTAYLIRGAGRGHGLGLCQWGAEGRARAGQTFRQILRAYYPGTRLSDEKP
ncbi:MAG TPA: SpoIID/LytB domain-containing protein [Armatimonadota bacterium]|nr:SpoIID/LytB domain-containing protein [Armatimonadota bacterium]HOS42841.1 SpoIID/LytB domain-containing protein [Armatimonadota bacterium]